MEHKMVYLLFIFIVYSFVGWFFESLLTSIKEKRFVNRGMLNLPFVIVYGITAMVISVAFYDTTNIILIFIGSCIYSSIIELSAGKLLELLNKGRWWDYSKKPFNIDGYICLEVSIVWGLLGIVSCLLVNPLLANIFNMCNYYVLRIIVMVVLIAMVIDFIISYISLIRDKSSKIVKSKHTTNLLNHTFNRIVYAYPIKKNNNTFSRDSFNTYKFLLYLIVGGVLGCLCEMVFCRFTMHKWMSRSSLLFGEISLVWGLALAIFTAFLHMHRKESSLFIFVYGLLLGTSFEYFCGSLCEYLYNYAFWSYKHLPLNINGRIQLVFALIWGVVAVVYIKYVYKFLNKLIEKIPESFGKVFITVITILLLADVAISTTAGIRFNERRENLPPSNIVEEYCDKYFTDEYMLNRFKNLKLD